MCVSLLNLLNLLGMTFLCSVLWGLLRRVTHFRAEHCASFWGRYHGRRIGMRAPGSGPRGWAKPLEEAKKKRVHVPNTP